MDRSLFDPEVAKCLRDKGMSDVLVNSGDFASDVAKVIDLVSASGVVFSNDDIRKRAVELGVGEPHHPNAWGAAICGAARRGAIKRVGYRRSEAKSRHAGLQALWIRND